MKILVIFNIKFKQDIEKLKKILNHNGFRSINSTTYLGDMKNDELFNLNSEISKISKENDSIAVIPLCKNCLEKTNVFGKQILLEEERYRIL